MSKFITYQNKPKPVHPKKAILLLLLMQTMIFIAKGQRLDTSAANITFQLTNNQANFSSVLRSLQQIAGAPEAFYSYFWEFGDGQFSFEEKPKHTYRDTGLFNARLFATNNYDDGKPPPLKPKPVRVKSKGNSMNLASKNPFKKNTFFKQGGAIEMRVNAMPRPDEDMVLIIGYRNEKEITAMNGSMVLFYNEKQFKKNNFNLSEERTYNNEQKTSLSSIMAYVPGNQNAGMNLLAGPNAFMEEESSGYYGGNLAGLIAAKQKIFRQNQTWKFNNLETGNEKYFFITLHTTPEMIKDTNAVIELTGMFIPDNPALGIEEYTMELQIVASHDPNRMMLKNRRLNYRFTNREKEMIYTVRFQNTGKGPARQVSVAVSVPPMMDANSIEILDYYPKVPFCREISTFGMASCLHTIIGKDSVYFIFKDIYLPGLRQQGFSDVDSTMGFIKYRLHFNKKLKKLPFLSNAAITFDNNKPVYTNPQKGYFKPGKSYGIIAGYNFFLDKKLKDENYFSIGGSISPYAPYRKYLQEELYLGYLQLPERQVGFGTENKDTIINAVQYHIFQREIFTKLKIIKLDLVPLQLRYNFFNWMGAGLGSILSFNAYNRINNRQVIYMQQQPNPTPIIIGKEYSTTKWFTGFDAAVFADVQFGRVRVGPVLGARFVHYFRVPRNGLYAYLAWRL
ncbi:MAG: PKD domain-containing protein [Ferruginibacter sp.]